MVRALSVLLAAAAAACGQNAGVTAAAYYQQAVNNPRLLQNGLGEDFCWNGAYYLKGFVAAYRAWRDRSWLDFGVKYYDFLASKMQTGPDGYRGWIGPYEYDHSVWCDVHVGDAIMLDGMLDFAELVLQDDGLRKTYGDAARRYVEIARRDLFEKWDKRGTWHQDGPFGAYRSWNVYADPGDLHSWRVREQITESRLVLPFNKQDDVASVAMKLYRITGDRQYFRRAAAIFAYQKRRFQYFDEHYVWNYWEPFGPEDVDLAARKPRHWINVHPNRPYQAGEVDRIVEAYHTGVIFTAEDMRRILNTNLRVMWNGDLAAPLFRNSNATLAGAPAASTAGAVWGALADFSPAIRDILKAQYAHASKPLELIHRAYFEKVTLATPPGFTRRYGGAADAQSFPMHECAGLNVAAALPAVFAAGSETILMTSLRTAGNLEIALYSADGLKKVAMLWSGRRSGLVLFPWKGDTPGEYRVRWTCDGAGYREFGITITSATSSGGR
jgi:hypothetical protein